MLAELARLLVRWRPVFPRYSTWVRVVAVLLGLIIAQGRRTVTASIAVRGRKMQAWAADYLVFSRAPWKVQQLFDVVVEASVETLDRFCTGKTVVVAVDDTSLRKTGKTIAAARWLRDPLSPPFHLNLRWGLRYLHMALLLPLHQHGLDPRAVSIDFTPAPSLKKPGKKASDEQREQYREQKKQHNLSTIAVERFQHLRNHLDAGGYQARPLLMVGDGSYTNRTVLKNMPDRVDYVGRTRGDLALYAPAPEGGRKVYGERLPTPDALRTDPEKSWTHIDLFYAGALRNVRYKELTQVLWPTGGRRRLLRLLVIAPTPYRAPGHGRRRTYYRDPAYLLTTDLLSPASELIQYYLARWQIEVEHRDLKTGLGVGQAQVWNDLSVSRLHSAQVALWSLVKLAALRTHGLLRSDAYPARPAWYPQHPDDRPSQADITDVLRADLANAAFQLPPSLPPRHFRASLPGPSHRNNLRNAA